MTAPTPDTQPGGQACLGPEPPRIRDPFVVRHYFGDERPMIKGNGFDGLSVGEDRRDAEEFVAAVNELRARADMAEARVAALSASIEHCSQGSTLCWEAERDSLRAKYDDLIFAVGNKYPGESRHDTAKRYIMRAENQDHGPSQGDAALGEQK